MDRASQEDIDGFNKLLNAYQEIDDPTVKDQRESLQDKFEAMKDIFNPNNTLKMRAEETDRPRPKLEPKDK